MKITLKKVIQSLLLMPVVMFATALSCHAQNGPTQPSVVLNWTQSTSSGITKNCIYRGTASGTYVLPGTCIPVATTYTDSTAVAGTTYYYAVTAQVSGVESAYSTPVQVAVPANPSAPTGLTAPTVSKNLPLSENGIDVQAKVEWIKPRR